MSRAIRIASSNKRRLTLTGAIVLALAATLGAVAFFTNSGSGTKADAASIGHLDAPTITSATPGAGTVTLTWSTVSPPVGSDPVTYYVTRVGGSVAGDCPTSGSPAAVTTCTDDGLAATTYHYTVTAKWHTWTATSSTADVTLGSGAASKIVLSGGTSLVSGSSELLTATIEDAAGNTVTSGADSGVSVTFAKASGAGTVSGLGSSPASGGVATKSVTGVLAGLANLTATATLSAPAGSTTSNTLAVTVTFGPATQIVLTGGSSLASASSETLTATIEDAAGNTVTGGADATRVVTFAQPSGAGSVSGLGTATAAGGVATKSVTGVLAGLANLTATATLSAPAGSTTSNTLAVTVTFGPLDHFTFVLATPQTSGVAFTGTNTLTAKDAAGNTITNFSAASNNVTVTANTGLTGTVTFTTGATGAVLNGSSDFTSGVANLTATTGLGMTFTGSGAGTFTATSGGKTGTSGSVTITSAAPTAVSIDTTNGTTAGTIDTNDTIVFTFSKAMKPSSILSGFTGASTVVDLCVSSASPNVLTITTGTPSTACNSGPTVNLGSVSLGTATYTSATSWAEWPATMAFNGGDTVLTITLTGGCANTSNGTCGSKTSGYISASIFTWNPSASATDTAGDAMSTTPVNSTSKEHF